MYIRLALDDAIIHGHTSYLAHVLALGHLSADDDNDIGTHRHTQFYNDAHELANSNWILRAPFSTLTCLPTREGTRQIFVSSSPLIYLTFNIIYNELYIPPPPPPRRTPISQTIERAVRRYLCIYTYIYFTSILVHYNNGS